MTFTAEDLDLMARTIWGEARDQPWDGKLAVGWTIRTRAEHGGWWGHTIVEVCQKPWQYSVWNANDPNRPLCERVRAERDSVFRQCLGAAAAVLTGLIPDPTGGATHYHTAAVQPAWALGKTPCASIGAHRFYRDID